MVNQLIEGLVADAVREIEERHGVSIEVELSSRGMHIVSLDRTTGERGSGKAALKDLIGVADRYGIGVSLSVLEAHPKLISIYREAGFIVSGVPVDDASQDQWLREHREEWQAAEDEDEQIEPVHMHIPTTGYVSNAAAGLAYWLSGEGVGGLSHSSVDSVIRSARLPSRDDLLAMPAHERSVVMSTILDRVAAAYTNVEPEALAAVTASMIEGDDSLGWFVSCLNGMAARDEQVSGPKM